MEFNHISVLRNESIEGLNINPNGFYVDCTLGGGGHSLEIAKRLDNGKLISIDKDEDALNFAKTRLSEYLDKIIFVKGNFADIDKILDNAGVENVDGILADLGVSSYQLDTGERGFSFKKDARLDMRMDKSQSLDAEFVVNNYS